MEQNLNNQIKINVCSKYPNFTREKRKILFETTKIKLRSNKRITRHLFSPNSVVNDMLSTLCLVTSFSLGDVGSRERLIYQLIIPDLFEIPIREISR